MALSYEDESDDTGFDELMFVFNLAKEVYAGLSHVGYGASFSNVSAEHKDTIFIGFRTVAEKEIYDKKVRSLSLRETLKFVPTIIEHRSDFDCC